MQQDQWGNAITVTQDEENYIYFRAMDNMQITYPLTTTNTDLLAINSFNGMQPE
jgi:hypothetical protein